jgi:hypothetical protein
MKQERLWKELDFIRSLGFTHVDIGCVGSAGAQAMPSLDKRLEEHAANRVKVATEELIEALKVQQK